MQGFPGAGSAIICSPAIMAAHAQVIETSEEEAYDAIAKYIAELQVGFSRTTRDSGALLLRDHPAITLQLPLACRRALRRALQRSASSFTRRRSTRSSWTSLSRRWMLC
jgi:hypothetical protein